MAKAGTVRRGPEPDLRHIVNAAREAREAFEASRHRRRLRAGAWLLLACLAASPAAAGLTFPERTVALVPAAGMIYDQLGWDINIYGLDIRDVDLQHLVIDGKKVIAVKGELVNVSSTSRKIPWLRFGLRSNAQTELYHWTLDTEIRPLKPGESTSFVTRLASPPDSASNLEIRFAQGDEIGSNTTP